MVWWFDSRYGKTLSLIVTKLFIRRRKLIFHLFLSHSPILNTTQYFIMKRSNKKELQQIEPNHSSDNDFKWTVMR